jgi:uncharacterized protein (UPF0548 family)
MFYLRPPADSVIERFLAGQRALPFSYEQVEATRVGDSPPAGYNRDHNRVMLGSGRQTFLRACEAVRRWKMFNLGWVKLLWPTIAVEPGNVVGVLASTCGLLTLNACRIVYTIDDSPEVTDFATARYGFAYGTLPGHLERGEERFSVEWRRPDRGGDDSVWYDILAISRPRHPLAIAGYPLARVFQKRFARDSKQAMLRAVKQADG